MTRSFVTAVRTLTLFPLPGKDTDEFSSSLPFFPLAGAFLGIVLWGCAIVLAPVLEPIPYVRALLVTLLLTVLTGGIHVDGLADSADGLLGGRDRETKLRIMKDSRVGVFGVIAIVLDLMLRVILIEHLFLAEQLVFLPIVIVFSRTVQALLFSAFPYARGNEGTGAPFAKGRKYRAILVVQFSLVCAGMGCWLGWPALIPIASAFMVAGLLGMYCKAQIGGITGDCVGATNELFELTAILMFVSVVPGIR